MHRGPGRSKVRIGAGRFCRTRYPVGLPWMIDRRSALRGPRRLDGGLGGQRTYRLPLTVTGRPGSARARRSEQPNVPMRRGSPTLARWRGRRRCAPQLLGRGHMPRRCRTSRCASTSLPVLGGQHLPASPRSGDHDRRSSASPNSMSGRTGSAAATRWRRVWCGRHHRRGPAASRAHGRSSTRWLAVVHPEVHERLFGVVGVQGTPTGRSTTFGSCRNVRSAARTWSRPAAGI